MNGSRVAGLCAGLVCLASTVAWAGPTYGWRSDGTGRLPVDELLTDWSADKETWFTPTAAWANASPVPLGRGPSAQVCVTEEPTSVACFSARTGALTWRATNGWVDTLSGEARGAGQALLASADDRRAAVSAAQTEVGLLRRELRRAAGDPAVADKLAAASARLDAAKTALDEVAVYETPPVLDMIGYASATPAVQGDSLVAQFGHGVVSRFDAKGTRLWSVWLGPPPRPMVGYEFGSPASPVWVDDVVLVGQSKLTALDAATGKVLWQGPAWRHYGAPTVMRVGDMPVVLTPDGTAYRLSDGRVLAQNLGDIWYTNVVTYGDVAYWAGGYGDDNRPGNAHVTAVRLAPDGAGGLTTTQLFKVDLPVSQRVYAAPVVTEQGLYVVSRTHALMALDRRTGAVRTTVDLGDLLVGDVLQPLAVTKDKLWVGSETGQAVVRRLDADLSHHARVPGRGGMRTIPLFAPGSAWVRTLQGLHCIGSCAL